MVTIKSKLIATIMFVIVCVIYISIFSDGKNDVFNKTSLARRRYDVNEEKVLIAILDTGISEELLQYSKYDIGTYNVIERNKDATDYFGHGSWITSICIGYESNENKILGINPNANLLIIKVTDDFGITSPSHLAEGIIYAVKNNADIINVSIGSFKSNEKVMQAIKYAKENNCIVVSCTGNDGENIIQYPSKYSDVISVGATHYNEKAKLSNYGMGTDVLAPGIMIQGVDEKNKVIKKSGTSASTIIVSSSLSVLIEKFPTLSNQQIIKCLYFTSKDIENGDYHYTVGRDIISGYGIINLNLCIEKAYELSIDKNLELADSYVNWYDEAVKFCIKTNLFMIKGNALEESICVEDFKGILINFSNMVNEINHSNSLESLLYNYTYSDNLTRIKALCIMFEYLNIDVDEYNVCSNILLDFTNIPNEGKNILSYAYQKGFINGTPENMFLPLKNISYIELSQIIYNMYLYFKINNTLK